MTKNIFTKSSVDSGTFKAHPTRYASTSKAGLQGASIEEQGSWSNKSTWQRLYNKSIVEEGKIFQEMVFKSVVFKYWAPRWEEPAKLGKDSIRLREIL